MGGAGRQCSEHRNSLSRRVGAVTNGPRGLTSCCVGSRARRWRGRPLRVARVLVVPGAGSSGVFSGVGTEEEQAVGDGAAVASCLGLAGARVWAEAPAPRGTR